MVDHVWVTYRPQDVAEVEIGVGECQCWRDALCRHGWTWQEPDNWPDCVHTDSFIDDVHVSLADAVRDLFKDAGGAAVGRLLRERSTVYVMGSRDTAALVDDHDADAGPAPLAIIKLKTITPRSRPGDPFRRRLAQVEPTRNGHQPAPTARK